VFGCEDRRRPGRSRELVGNACDLLVRAGAEPACQRSTGGPR
jgi:hypothetical protein